MFLSTHVNFHINRNKKIKINPDSYFVLKKAEKTSDAFTAWHCTVHYCRRQPHIPRTIDGSQSLHCSMAHKSSSQRQPAFSFYTQLFSAGLRLEPGTLLSTLIRCIWNKQFSKMLVTYWNLNLFQWGLLPVKFRTKQKLYGTMKIKYLYMYISYQDIT